jgi:hypothetical protein
MLSKTPYCLKHNLLEIRMTMYVVPDIEEIIKVVNNN